jgi:hypothetical protein
MVGDRNKWFGDLGKIFAAAAEGTLDARMVCEHFEGNGLQAPINIM